MGHQDNVPAALQPSISIATSNNKKMTMVRTNITPLLKCTAEDGLEGLTEGLQDFSQAIYEFN